MRLVDKEEFFVFYTITSEKDFSQVIEDVKQALSEIKFAVIPWKGEEIQGEKLVELIR